MSLEELLSAYQREWLWHITVISCLLVPDMQLHPQACSPWSLGVHSDKPLVTVSIVQLCIYDILILLSSEAIHQRLLYSNVSDITCHSTDIYLLVLGDKQVSPEKKQRNILLVTKEALIGEICTYIHISEDHLLPHIQLNYQLRSYLDFTVIYIPLSLTFINVCRGRSRGV